MKKKRNKNTHELPMTNIPRATQCISHFLFNIRKRNLRTCVTLASHVNEKFTFKITTDIYACPTIPSIYISYEFLEFCYM